MDLIDELDSVLLRKEKHDKQAHYPSEATDCLRKVYYRWTDTQPSNPIEAGGLWKMRFGDAVHKLVPDLLRGAEYEVEEEVPVEYSHSVLKYPIHGRIDIRFRRQPEVWQVMEVKSTFGRGVRAIRESGAPREEHLNQLILYMEMGQYQKGCILYLGRDDAYRTVFNIERNGQTAHTFNNLISRFQLIEMCVDKQRAPNREYKVAIKNGEIKDKFVKQGKEYRSAWQCQYCPYTQLCWKDELGRYAASDNAEEL